MARLRAANVDVNEHRQPPAVRRRMIVEAASGIIMRQGLAATRLRDIAKAAEVSVGTVTYHFAGVSEILNEVVVLETERFYASIIDEAKAEPDPVKALLMLIDPLFDDSQESAEHWRMWSDYWTIVVREPEIAAEYSKRIRIWETCFIDTIRRGVDAGVFGTDSPEEVALKVAAYSDGIATQMSQSAVRLSAETARRWLREMLSTELRAAF